MARLPWQNGRSRTKSGSDKTVLGTPSDWFSRNTSEPSRQALAELVRVHRREQSEGSPDSSPRSTSRSTNATSNDWSRFRQRTESGSETTWNALGSPNQSREDSVYSSTDKNEGSVKILTSKGNSTLRRTGSKMSLSSIGSSSTLGFNPPSRSQSISHSSTRRSSRDDMKPKISAPFDFQHVTHTEQTHFAGLGRIEETELAYRFSTIVTDQTSATELRGIEASAISCKDSTGYTNPKYLELDDAGNKAAQISTPPSPPPKDTLQKGTTSRDTSLSYVLDSPVRISPFLPQFLDSRTSSTMGETDARKLIADDNQKPGDFTSLAVDSDAEFHAKPLPELPIIHAVTTDDNSARALIAAPLPTPPGSASPASDADPFVNKPFHHRQKSSMALPRHYSFYPSTKSSMPNLVSTGRATNMTNTLSRHHSDMALSKQAREPEATLSTRTSMSFAAVDTMDWEAAIDEAWDDSIDDQVKQQSSRSNPSRFNAAFGESGAEDFGHSADSTPLMMKRTQAPISFIADSNTPVVVTEVHKLESVQEDELMDSLAGLGILSFSASRLPVGISTHKDERPSLLLLGDHDTLTRSSSQESMVLSLTSSLIETQRSSKSSVLSDHVTYPESTERPSGGLAVPSENGERYNSTRESKQWVTRPESGCLPSDIYEQCQSRYGNDAEINNIAKGSQPDPTVARHAYSQSASKVAVPERGSSIVYPEAKPVRLRSNTMGTRPRMHARVSYSLFPAQGAPSVANATSSS